jgi:hypothetical protein
MKNFNDEELKTTIGHIMLDLRGNWGWDYEERILIIIECLDKLLEQNLEKDSLLKDLDLCKSSLKSEYRDGRVFRDCGELYGYSSEQGRTERVFEFLQDCLTHPDSNNFELDIEKTTSGE